MRTRGTLLVCAVVLALAHGVVWGQRMAPMLEGTGDSQQIRVLVEEAGKGVQSAWEQLRDLQRGHEAVLLSAGASPSGLQVAEGLGWLLRGFDGETRGRLRASADADVRLRLEWEALEAATGEERLADLLAFSRRAGPTASSAAALDRAAAMVEARGDVVNAAALRERASAWASAEAVRPTLSASVPAASGVLQEYWWLNKLPDRLGGMRGVVAETDGGRRLVLGSATHVVAMEGGRVVWGWPTVPQAGASKTPVDDLAGRLEFPVYGVVEVGGLVVARMLGGQGAVVRALRSEDGGELWSSEDVQDWAGWHVASMPAVVGGWGYVMVADSGGGGGGGAGGAGGGTGGRVSVVGFEVASGRVLFRTPVGVLADGRVVAGRGRVARGGGRTPGLWDEQTAPLVDGDRVIVVAGGGVFAVDRIDGQVLRAAGYATSAGVAKEGNSPAELPMSRWQTTPVVWGDLVVAGPRDADAVMAWDRRTLSPAWVSPRMGAYTVIGVVEGQVIVQGNEIAAVSLADGKRGWQTAPRTQSRFTGPAVVVGEVVVVPTSTGTMAMSARTGQWLPAVPVTVEALSLRLTGESAGVLRAADVLAMYYSPSQVVQLGRRESGGGENRGPDRVVPGPRAVNVSPGNQSPPPIDARPGRQP